MKPRAPRRPARSSAGGGRRRAPRRSSASVPAPTALPAVPAAGPRVVVGMSNLKATLIALAVAAAFFNFAIQWRPWIIIAIVIAAAFFGMRWLIRHHPYVAIFIIAFLRGLLGSRR